MKTYTIDTALISRFEEKLISFKKKFAKYGNGSVVYTVSLPYAIKHSDHSEQLVVDISVDASYQISGYSFVALLERTSNGNVIKTASDDVKVPEIYRDRYECDHCKSNRDRKYTVVLKNDETGEYVQVGKSCCKDYLGRDMADYAAYLSFYEKLDEDADQLIREFRNYTPCYKFEDIIYQTLERVSRFGYISKSKAYDTGATSTSSAVYCAFNGRTIGEEKFEIYEVSNESREKYVEILAYLESLTDEDDYHYNIKMLSTLDYIENSNLGLVVSIVGSWLRDTAIKKQREEVIPSNYVGEIGERLDIVGTPVCIHSYLGEFGWTYIYKLTINNDVIIWKTNKALDEVEMTIKATVKEHSEYNGVKQTVITRGRIAK